MPENHDQQQAEEKRIVEAFLHVAQMPCQSCNIFSLDPPQPDALCKLEDGTQLAFELTEVIDPNQARNYNFGLDIKDTMYPHYADMEPEIKTQLDALFGNAAIFVAFQKGASLNKATRLLPDVFAALLKCSSDSEGDLARELLPEGIERITVARGEMVGPLFNASGLALHIRNTITERINQKFAKKYECDFPVDLLVHSRLKSLQPEILWLDKVRKLVPPNIRGSSFQRVWIFDYVESNIPYVYPDV